jgi:TnpA family transposase
MCRLLGFRFAPRIRDLKEKRLYLLPGTTVPPELASMVGGTINIRVVSDHWFELLRLALSIKTGTVTASVILRKLAAYPGGTAWRSRCANSESWNDFIYAPMAAGPRTAPS